MAATPPPIPKPVFAKIKTPKPIDSSFEESIERGFLITKKEVKGSLCKSLPSFK